jgi:hypothetical protein
MKKTILGLLIVLCSSCGLTEEPFYVLKIGEELTIKSEFGINRFLLRKVNLGKKPTLQSNNVVNFGGARIVSAFSDMEFNRGYAVSGEVDDVAPVRFNETYMGGNHGAAVGVTLQAAEHGLTDQDLGSVWTDGIGGRFLLFGIDQGQVTFVSDPSSLLDGWRFVSRVHGAIMSEADGDRTIHFASPHQVQVFPSVERGSVTVDAGEGIILDEDYQEVKSLKIVEQYNLVNPAYNLRGCSSQEECRPDAKVVITYTIIGNETDIQTRVEAVRDLRDFSSFGVQATPLNFSDTQLLQYVPGSSDFDDWTDITGITNQVRIETEEKLPSMAQRVERDTLMFGQTVGFRRAPQINGKDVGTPGAVEVSTSRKQYPIAIEPGAGGFDGTLKAGDVAEVWAFKRYWAGKRDGQACFMLLGYGRCI